MSVKTSAIIGSALFFGLVILGLSMKSAVKAFKGFERIVAVKGLAEKEVEANLVIWPISYSKSSNSLSDLYKSIGNDTSKINAFLRKNQVSKKEIIENPPAVTDRFSGSYVDTTKVKYRYTINKTITIRSNDVKKILKLKTTASDLINEGIVLKTENYSSRTQYLYTKLNEIKPLMIKEATEKARDVALQFAQDSKSRLGKIRYANQGLFSINTLDESLPYMKKVRVVTSVTYYLKD